MREMNLTADFDPAFPAEVRMATVPRRKRAATMLRGITYQTYVRTIRHPANRHLRMAYHDGTLEFMSPRIRKHEQPSDRIRLIISTVAVALKINYEGTGKGTFRRAGDGPLKGTGKEPDQSFYFASLDRLPTDRDPNLDQGDPAPDLWVEVDHRSSSQARLPTYARLGVPEVWQYRVRSRTIRFLEREGDDYKSIDRSLALPVLTPSLIVEALKAGETMREGEWIPWLQEWVKQFVTR